MREGRSSLKEEMPFPLGGQWTAMPDLPHLQKLGPAGLRSFFRIVGKAWKLPIREQMLLLDVQSSSTFRRWRASPSTARFTRDRLERISHVLGIYKSLQVLLPNRVVADAWPTRPNDAALFRGQRAIDVMASGGMLGLVAVRQYLNAQIEG